jgi:hypothetical protein
VIPLPEEATAVVVISEAPPILSSTSQITTGAREDKASLPVPRRKTGFNKEKRIVFLFAMVLLLEFSCGPSIFGVVQRAVQNTSDAATTAWNKAYNARATAQAQIQAEANATAEAVANVSPIAYPPQNKSPVLNDPLQDNSKGNSWEIDDPRYGNCKFINRAYDINTHSFELCFTKTTDFTNFIYEVQMKIVKGDGGGIAFRIYPTNEYLYYYFAINQEGSYRVHAFTASKDAVLTQSFSLAILRGLNQINLIAVVVHGNIIELYVNHQRVAVVGSSTYTHGRVGVIVTGSERNQTEVIFQNAKVWKL